MKEPDNYSQIEDSIVCNVDIDKYMGVWYEIARLPHFFEREMERVTATYTKIGKSKVSVVNQGYRNGKKKVARGNAKVMDLSCLGKLGVSFFPLVRSPYYIIHLDKDYRFAVVTSGKDYLWFLSRTPHIEDSLYGWFVSFAQEKGFSVEQLIRVQQ
jgi:lipocalin